MGRELASAGRVSCFLCLARTGWARRARENHTKSVWTDAKEPLATFGGISPSLLRPPHSSEGVCLGGGLSANADTCFFQPWGGLGHGTVAEPLEFLSLPLSWAQALLLLLSTMTAKL